MAYKHCNNYKFKFSNEDEEEAIHFFYKDSDSLLIDESSKKINFNGRKIFTYLHGGYWQWGSIFASSFMAQNFTSKDIICAAIGYKLCPKSTQINFLNKLIFDLMRFCLSFNEYFGATSRESRS
jgi:hypothetical protein